MRDAILVAKVDQKETKLRVPNDVTEDQMWDMAAENAERQLSYEWFVTPPQEDEEADIADKPRESRSL